MKNNSNFNIYSMVPPKGISWRAIFAGTITALSVMLIFNLIGLFFGLWSIGPMEKGNSLSDLGTGAIIWWILSNLLVLIIGGFVAARLGISLTNTSGLTQGVITWAFYTLISAWLVTSVIGIIISGVGNVVGCVSSTSGQVVEDQGDPIINDQFKDLVLSLDDAREELYSLLKDTSNKKFDPSYLESQANSATTEAQGDNFGIRWFPRGEISGIPNAVKNS